jgi:O-antigen/teichoic acid export membrane protein
MPMPGPNAGHYDSNVNRSDLSMEFTPVIDDVVESPQKSRWISALLGDFTWTLLGNGVFAACQWGIIIVLAKLVTAVAVGQYSLGQAILAPTLMFAAFQLRAAIASDLQNQFTTREYFGFRLTTLFTGLLLAVLIAFATTRSPLQTAIVGVIGLIQVAELTSDTLYGFHQRRGDLIRPALSMTLKGPIGLLALSLGVYWTHKVLVGLVGLLSTRVVLLVVYDLRNAFNNPDSIINRASEYFRWRRHVQLFRGVFFMGLMTMLIALVGMIPRYFVQFYCGPRDLGVFGAISSLISIGLMPVGAMGLAAFVPLARAFSEGLSHDFLKILGVLLSLSLTLGVAGVTLAYLAGSQILTLLFRAEYAAYTDLFRWIMVAGAVTFVTNSLGASLTAARIFRPQVIILLIVAVAESAGCWALMPRLGLMGAVWACLGATMIQFVGVALVLVMQFPRRAPQTLAATNMTS